MSQDLKGKSVSWSVECRVRYIRIAGDRGRGDGLNFRFLGPSQDGGPRMAGAKARAFSASRQTIPVRDEAVLPQVRSAVRQHQHHPEAAVWKTQSWRPVPDLPIQRPWGRDPQSGFEQVRRPTGDSLESEVGEAPV